MIGAVIILPQMIMWQPAIFNGLVVQNTSLLGVELKGIIDMRKIVGMAEKKMKKVLEYGADGQ